MSLLKPRLHGRIAAKIAEQENDCEDATEDLEESNKFLADLEVNCEHTTNIIGRVWQYDATGMLLEAQYEAQETCSV